MKVFHHHGCVISKRSDQSIGESGDEFPEKDVSHNSKEQRGKWAALANSSSSEEGLKGASSDLNVVLIFDIESFDGSEEEGGEADVVEDFPHEVVGKAREGSLEVEENEGRVVFSKTEFHSLVFNVEDVGEHAPAAQESSLRLADPFIEDRFENKTKGSSKDAIVSVDDRKGSSLGRSKHSTKNSINEGGFLGEAVQEGVVEIIGLGVR